MYVYSRHVIDQKMGLDIHIGVNNRQEIYSLEYYTNPSDHRSQHRLSRTFCNLMSRKHVIDHEPELDQLARLAGVDISPLHEMEKYPDEENMYLLLKIAKSEEQKQDFKRKAEEDKVRMDGNIDKVLQTVTDLIHKLCSIGDLPRLLIPTYYDSLGNEEYFSDFNIDKGNGYIGNNFGQDLRNFKRFLEFAKSKGTRTVWFSYG